MQTLVTGATGLVGHAIVQHLRARGRHARLLVRDVDKAARLFPDCELVAGDITDAGSVRRALEGCEVAYHAAGLPEQWLPDPETFDRVNRGGTENIVEAALAMGLRRLVYTSTIDVFADEDGELVETRIDPHPKHTTYERSKQAADRVVVRALERGLDAVFLHPAAVYGPGPAGSPGVNDFVTKLRDGKVPAVPPGGMPVVFVDDVGEGHVRAEERADSGARFILSERYVTMKELGRLAAEALGVRPPPAIPYPAAKALSLVTEAVSRLLRSAPLLPAGQLAFLQWGARPNSARARAELELTFTPLPEGLSRLVAWLRSEAG